MKSRVYHDPIHGAIELKGQDPVEQMVIELIDTPEFQRLRRVRQLDIAHLTFHGAEGSRFTHSLGVLAVARRIFERLCRTHPDLLEYRALVLAAALLHDVGHGPFSHASEEIFNYDHETWTQKIILGDTPIHAALTRLDPDLPEQLQQVLTGEFPIPLITQLVSGQLDADRLDYLLRDSYFTGAKYGQLDLDRLVGVLDYDRCDQTLVVKGNKGLIAVEHYLVVRYFMHTQIYNHPKNLAARFVLKSILYRARELLALGQLWVDDWVAPWFTLPPSAWTLDMYLACDDVVMNYHIQRWQQAEDPVLAGLCHQLIDRNLPKTADVTHLTQGQRQHVLERLAPHLDTPPMYALGLKEAKVKGYSLYDRGIFLKTEGQPAQEIADCSHLVRSLLLTPCKVWLIYPRSLAETVARSIEIEQAMAGLGT